MMDPALTVALVGAAVSLIVGVLGHRRSKAVDATSAQSGVAANGRAGTQQVIDGLNLLVDQLQEEVAWLRKKYGDNGDTPQPENKS